MFLLQGEIPLIAGCPANLLFAVFDNGEEMLVIYVLSGEEIFFFKWVDG